jgi:hypothetical protein
LSAWNANILASSSRAALPWRDASNARWKNPSASVKSQRRLKLFVS